MSERRALPGARTRRRLSSSLALLGLVAGLAGPLASAVLQQAPAEYCRSRGRCCCAAPETTGTCVRATCSCGRDAVAQPPASLRPAVLVRPEVAFQPTPSAVRFTPVGARPTEQARRPLLPPPRLPARPAPVA